MTDLDIRYRDFRHYMIDYLEVQEAKYNTEQEEAISCLTQTQVDQERRRDPRCSRNMEMEIAIQVFRR